MWEYKALIYDNRCLLPSKKNSLKEHVNEKPPGVQCSSKLKQGLQAACCVLLVDDGINLLGREAHF